MSYKWIAVALLLAGCAPTSHQKLIAPSTVPTQHQIDNAQSANQSAQQHNEQAQSFNDRIDAKDRIIDQWHREHGQ
jgi:hypothetical protein